MKEFEFETEQNDWKGSSLKFSVADWLIFYFTRRGGNFRHKVLFPNGFSNTILNSSTIVTSLSESLDQRWQPSTRAASSSAVDEEMQQLYRPGSVASGCDGRGNSLGPSLSVSQEVTVIPNSAVFRWMGFKRRWGKGDWRGKWGTDGFRRGVGCSNTQHYQLTFLSWLWCIQVAH